MSRCAVVFKKRFSTSTRILVKKSSLIDLLFDKTLASNRIVFRESVISKILDNGDEDTLSGFVDLCPASTEFKIVDAEPL